MSSDHGRPLREQDAETDPHRQFSVWFAAAQAAGIRLPEAAALATSSPDGAPSVRMVLVKGFADGSFRFYSNYASRKGRELAANPQGALLFDWDELGRQVRIEGPVERIGVEESARYASSRPRRSQLSALASPQSEVIDSRAELERRVAELERLHGDGDVPLPASWGGYRLTARTFEFWQQRDDRLHDRLRYRRAEDAWLIERLAP
ncbi:MAG TPA: pyridoxamine 5'-phosphate oxidase [Solirubrobacteraceae bacterium]